LINAKEKLLSFINAENDDLESEILRLNDNLIQELNKVEFNHKTAIQELIGKYESSLGKMKDEITLTVKKLKENATYFENVLNEQEEEYNEVTLVLAAPNCFNLVRTGHRCKPVYEIKITKLKTTL
jgi:hypothetical protein